MDNPVVALRGRFAELADGSLQAVSALIADGRDVDAEVAAAEDAALAAEAAQHTHSALSKEEQIDAAIERRVRRRLLHGQAIQDLAPDLAAKVFAVMEDRQASYQSSGASARAHFEWMSGHDLTFARSEVLRADAIRSAVGDRRGRALAAAEAAALAAEQANAPTPAEEEAAWQEWQARPANEWELAQYRRWLAGEGTPEGGAFRINLAIDTATRAR